MYHDHIHTVHGSCGELAGGQRIFSNLGGYLVHTDSGVHMYSKPIRLKFVQLL